MQKPVDATTIICCHVVSVYLLGRGLRLTVNVLIAFDTYVADEFITHKFERIGRKGLPYVASFVALWNVAASTICSWQAILVKPRWFLIAYLSNQQRNRNSFLRTFYYYNFLLHTIQPWFIIIFLLSFVKVPHQTT